MVSKKNTLMPIKVKKLNFEKVHRKLLTDISCEIKAKGITIIFDFHTPSITGFYDNWRLKTVF